MCVGKLRFVGRRPTRVRQKAENTSDEAADHFLRLDRNLKPRMKSLWHPGYTLLHIHTQITTKKGGTVLRCNATRKSSIQDKDKDNKKKTFNKQAWGGGGGGGGAYSVVQVTGIGVKTKLQKNPWINN